MPQKLRAPSPGVSKLPLSEIAVLASDLIRISDFATGEPFFGHNGFNRFDSPGCKTGKQKFAGCYFGLSLEVAFAESVLHDETPWDNRFEIAADTLESKYIHTFRGEPLRLADLTGAALKVLGGHADLAGTSTYNLTQKWSLAVFRNHGNYDGFVYMSRHLNTGKAVFVFDRAKSKLTAEMPTKLVNSTQFLKLMGTFSVSPV